MQRDLVPWDGREGLALNKLLAAKPKMTIEHAKKCVKNYYNSDLNIAVRPAGAKGVLGPTGMRMLEFWHETNQYGTPRFCDKDWKKEQQAARDASIGAH
jgi:hypothetical protein